MKRVIKIKPRTSLSALAEEWCVGEENEVVFEISKSSSFMLFAEGVALGYLQEIISSEKRISIRFHPSSRRIQTEKLLNSSPDSLSDIVELGIPELLCGIFGLQLLYMSGGLHDAFDELGDPSLARKHVGSIIWKTVLKQKGLLGDGKNQYLISRHDYRIPALLRSSDHISFPSSDLFRKKISPVIGSIGQEKVSSLDAKTLISSWIYHMAENAYEHGSVDYQAGNTVLEGYSGILIQKITTPNQDMISSRNDLDEKSKQYLRNLYKEHKFKNSDTLTVITVMDGGKGIHNTLPEKYDSISDIEKLNAAYKRGVTRHSIGEGRSGYGLYDSIRVAKKLKACVAVCSGNIYSFKTFQELGAETIEFDKDFEYTKKSSGTSQSIIWPSSPKR